MGTHVYPKWDWKITPRSSWLGNGWQELWAYRHLALGLIRRDFLLIYQQTILGPLWVLLQPVLTMLTYVLVFSRVVGISTDAVPPVLFYLSGIVLWNLFNDAFTSIAATFRDNAPLFSKIYFPRLIIPFSRLSGYLLHFAIQSGLLLLVLVFFVVKGGVPLPDPRWLPLALLAVGLVAGLSLGLGLLFAVLTAKYRDLAHLLSLGMRLFMFLTPVIYPLSYVSPEWRWLVLLNPLTQPFELFRLSLLGQGSVSWSALAGSMATTGIVLLLALLVFNKHNNKLIDVI